MADGFWSIKKGLNFRGFTMPTNPVNGDVYFDSIQGFLGYQNGSWGPLGGSGVINYDTNPAIGSTNGYNLYANTPGPIPVNGTGGVVTNLAFTSTQVSPIVGHTMGVLSKSAVNTQGEGLSYDFTIDSAFAPGLITVSFSYQGSANFQLGSGLPGSSSDIEVWAYDKTNNILLPVTPYQLTAGVVAPATFTGAFQANPNSVSYRLIWHIATTNASAWTFNMANVIITPQSIKNFNSAPASIIGQIIEVGTDQVPAGTLECDGSAKSRLTYNALFNKIGTRYGVGDGSTTFNLPDLRGGFTRGWDHSAGNDPDAVNRIKYPALTTFTITGTTDGTTAVITGVSPSDYLNLSLGMEITSDTGSSIPPGSIITALNGSGSFTINNPTTAATVGDTITLTAGATGDYVGSFQYDAITEHEHLIQLFGNPGFGGVGEFATPTGQFRNTIEISVLDGNTTISTETRPRNSYVMKCIIYDSALVLAAIGGTQVPVSAHLSTSDNGLTAGATVLFDTVESDNYGTYNPGTGIWTCPVSGIYLVSAQLCQNNTTSWNFAMDVYLNGSSIAHSEFNAGTGGILYTSAQVATTSSPISSGSVVPFSNSPAFTFTPSVSGTYKVYASVPLIQTGTTGQRGIADIYCSSGGATRVSYSEGIVYSNVAGDEGQSSAQLISVFTLVAGTPYVFDIEGAVTGGTVALGISDAPFNIYAEAVGTNTATTPTTRNVTLRAGDQIRVKNTSVSSGTSVQGGIQGNFLDIIQILPPQNLQPQGNPVGTMLDFGGANLPGGYLFCDGSSQLISDYPVLAVALFDQTTGLYAFGSADALHFNLPPGGVFYRAVDYASVNDPDNAIRTASAPNGNVGNKVGSFQDFAFEDHLHYRNTSGLTEDVAITNVSSGFQYPGGPHPVIAPLTTGPTYPGYNVSTETRPRNVYVNKIIKYL